MRAASIKRAIDFHIMCSYIGWTPRAFDWKATILDWEESMVNRDPGDETNADPGRLHRKIRDKNLEDPEFAAEYKRVRDRLDRLEPIDETPGDRVIPIARVEIDLPYGEPYDWNELNTQERENVVEWQHQVKRWKGRILARRLA